MNILDSWMYFVSLLCATMPELLASVDRSNNQEAYNSYDRYSDEAVRRGREGEKHDYAPDVTFVVEITV